MILGHGRADGPFPLNSLGSFLAARHEGADGVELDVRRTADDAIVVHHDPVLSDGRLLSATPLAVLPTHIATLEQVLNVCDGLIVNIEVKNYPGDPEYDPGQRLTDLVLDLLADRGGRDRVMVSSFGTDTIAHVRSRAPHLDTAALLFHPAPPWEKLAAVTDAGHRYVHPFNPLVDANFMAAARDHGLEVNVWSNDDETPDRLAHLLDLGVHGFITSEPAMARRCVAEARGR